ncbi:MAG: mannose-1-phosphate guanylyltransferase [Oligoflexales bacterium]|nr:mannose-1-phosphate guanylyltransferase [Oligoflexales bacterium]
MSSHKNTHKELPDLQTSSGDPVFAVILAGGSGTRFWPRSRQSLPKQLCAISNPDKTMIVETLERIEDFIPKERRLIVTHKDQKVRTLELISELCPRVLAEPCAKNTAAALLLAALDIKSRCSPEEKPFMISLHADHVIRDRDAFIESLQKGLAIAEKSYLTLIGLTPSSPETGYGYIKKGRALSESNSFQVESFQEKPSLDKAKQYMEQGDYLWNSGLFVWQVETLLEEFRKHAPKLLEQLETLFSSLATRKLSVDQLDVSELAQTYELLDSIAIDNAILEKSSNVAVIEADFGWLDLGSWSALEQVLELDSLGNLRQGETFLFDTQRSTVVSDGPFVAVLGVKDLVVVADKGCILVCHKDKAQDVKKVVEHLKKIQRPDLI